MSGGHRSIFRPLAPKRWATEKKVFWVTGQVPRELPFGDIATAQQLSTRPVEARVCSYQTDPPTDFLCAHMSRKRVDRFRLFKHCLSAGKPSGRARSMLCIKLEGRSHGGCEPPPPPKKFAKDLIFFESLHFELWLMALFFLHFIEVIL